jgi:hypothetical protein
MKPDATDVELVGVVAGIIAMLRKQWPQIDGLKLVLPLAALIAFAVCYVAQGIGTAWQPAALRALRIAAGALGGVSLMTYFLGLQRHLPAASSQPATDPK